MSRVEVTLDLTEVQQTFDFVKKNYKRRYTVTLAPTDDNFIKALEVWKYGITRHKGIVRAIIDIYGYRYRRLENFIRECQLWKEGKGWLHNRVLTKMYQEYMGTKKNSIRIELYLYHYLPEFLLGKHNLELCESFFNECIDSLGPDWSWALYVGGEFKVGDDVKLEEHDYLYCCTQDVDIEVVFWKLKAEWKIYDQAKFHATLANYVLYYLKLCPEERDWSIWV
jgi:hypothetical protein